MRSMWFTLWVQELFCLHILRGGGNNADISCLLGLKQQLVVDGHVLHAQVVQRLAVRDHHRHQIPGQGPLRAPWLTEAEDHIRLGGLAASLHGVLEGGGEAVSVVEDLGLFLLLKDVRVLHGR